MDGVPCLPAGALLNIGTAGFFGDYTLANFQAIFTSEAFWSSLRTTLIYSVLGTAGAIGLGLIAALALRKPFRGRTLVRASMLLPYVTPIVAATFAWTTMLNPQFGIVNEWGQQYLGWDEPIAFLSQKSSEVSVFGVEFTVPVALLTVIVFEWWRSFPLRFCSLRPDWRPHQRPWRGRPRRRRHPDAALPVRHPAATDADHRRAGRLALHLDVQQLRRHLPADRRPGRTDVVAVQVFYSLTARGDIGVAAAQALVLAAILAVFVGLYLRWFAPERSWRDGDRHPAGSTHATAGRQAAAGGGLSATRSRTACSPCSGGLSSPGCW